MKIRKRYETSQIKVKDILIGGNNLISIQSMTNTKTKNVKETVDQILRLEKVGCHIIRLAVLDEEDAKAIKEIKKHINIPLVADIHFDYKLAILSILSGADKIRLNPGNIKNKENIKKIVDLAKEKNIPIRIGVNSGSLPDNLKPTAKNLVKACEKEVKYLEELGFYDICLSLKATSVDTMIKAYKLASKTFKYPLHLGVTEAGTLIGGTVKSSIGIGTLLNMGIGNTIRVSLTEDPILEVKVAKQILNACNLADNIPNLISCPTCGRIEYDMKKITTKVEEYLQNINKKISVAIMGCVVNGPGEAREADIGIAGNRDKVIIFKKGKVYKHILPNEAYNELINLINEF